GRRTSSRNTSNSDSQCGKIQTLINDAWLCAKQSRRAALLPAVPPNHDGSLLKGRRSNGTVRSMVSWHRYPSPATTFWSTGDNCRSFTFQIIVFHLRRLLLLRCSNFHYIDISVTGYCDGFIPHCAARNVAGWLVTKALEMI